MMHRHLLYSSNNRDKIIIQGRPQKAAVHLGDGHDHAFRLQLLISDPQRTERLRAAYFIELCIVAMIHHSHLVGERIMNSYLGLVAVQSVRLNMNTFLLPHHAIHAYFARPAEEDGYKGRKE